MKPTLTAISILTTAVFFVSCGDPVVESASHEPADHSSRSVSDIPKDGLEGLGLNNGNKWAMDDHTRSMFAEMAGSFLDTDHSSQDGEDLKKTGSALQDDINELIQGCTMTGAAHDQLHIYLTGYIPAVAALSESGLIEDARKVEHYLEIYADYFE